MVEWYDGRDQSSTAWVNNLVKLHVYRDRNGWHAMVNGVRPEEPNDTSGTKEDAQREAVCFAGSLCRHAIHELEQL